MATISCLPPEILQIIFKLLDAHTILTLSETSKHFNEIVSSCDTLTRKLKLFLRFPQDLLCFTEFMTTTKRRYRALVIVKSRDRVCHHSVTTVQSLGHLCLSIKELSIDWSNALRPREASLFEIMNRRRTARGGLQAPRRCVGDQNMMDHFFDDAETAQGLAIARMDIYNEFVSIVRHFQNIEMLTLSNVHLERDRPPNEAIIQFSKLRSLVMKHCDSFCFDLLSSCKKLTNLVVIEPWFRIAGVDTFESFLITQTELRDLRIINVQYPRLFLNDISGNITFKLKTLILRNVFFADRGNAVSFIRNQTELRVIELQLQNEKVRTLDEVFYNNILRTIVTNCSSLEILNISKIRYKMIDLSFLSNIRNLKVRKLIFNVTAEDNSSRLFKVLVKMFPNLKSITFKAEESEDTDCGICFDEGTILESVDTLVVTNSSVRSLLNVYAPALRKFEYSPGKTGAFIDADTAIFFHLHRNIKHLTIGSRSVRSYFFVSYNLCELIVNFLKQLESITIYNFGEVNKSVKLLCKLPKLKALTLSTEDHQQFTPKTKLECAQNNIQLVSVDISV